MIFLLEDRPERIKWFRSHWPNMIQTDNPPDALDILRSGQEFELILLDHDLGGDEDFKPGPQGDGIVVAEAMANEKLHVGTDVFIHSCNPAGAQRMFMALRNTHKVKIMPFPDMKAWIEPEEGEWVQADEVNPQEMGG